MILILYGGVELVTAKQNRSLYALNGRLCEVCSSHDGYLMKPYAMKT
jgi:hypothetical protein